MPQIRMRSCRMWMAGDTDEDSHEKAEHAPPRDLLLGVLRQPDPGYDSLRHLQVPLVS